MVEESQEHQDTAEVEVPPQDIDEPYWEACHEDQEEADSQLHKDSYVQDADAEDMDVEHTWDDVDKVDRAACTVTWADARMVAFHNVAEVEHSRSLLEEDTDFLLQSVDTWVDSMAQVVFRLDISQEVAVAAVAVSWVVVVAAVLLLHWDLPPPTLRTVLGLPFFLRLVVVLAFETIHYSSRN